MQDENGMKSSFGRFDHVGVVVKDLDKAIKDLSSLGAGPFEPATWPPIVEKIFRGRPSQAKLEIRTGPIGAVQVELILHLEGESLAKEFLDTQGEGLQHLGFIVDDLDEEVTKLTQKGIKVLQSGRRAEGGGHAFIEVGGITLELTQRQPK